MNESEQAQAIAGIKARHTRESERSIFDVSGVDGFHDRATLLKIVDSQAQKIKEQAKEMEKLKSQYSHIVQTNRQRG